MPHPQDTPRVVFLDRDTLSPETRLRESPSRIVWRSMRRRRPSEVAERIRDADIVITNKAPRARGGASTGAKRLRLIAVAATGTDVVDVKACAARGDHRLQHPQLRGQHRAGAHLRADPGAAPQHPRLPASRWSAAGGRRRRSSASSTTRSATSPARRWASSATACSASRWRSSARRFGMRVLFSDYKGTDRHGAALHAVRGGAAHERRDHAALAADALDPQPDRARAEFAAMERTPAADQHRARRAGRRGRRWPRR